MIKSRLVCSLAVHKKVSFRYNKNVFLILFCAFCCLAALQERVSEIEDRCAQKLREMEIQVNTAKREHTKAGSGISAVLPQPTAD